MFTGIIEEVGRVVLTQQTRLVIAAADILKSMELGGSIAVNGICLTVTTLDNNSFSTGVMQETLKRSNLGTLSAGDRVNLESPLTLGRPLGGHLVQGHVDTIGRLASIRQEGESIRIMFEADTETMRYIVEKGFIAVDGISLTVTGRSPGSFEVSIVDYTKQHTNLGDRRKGDPVNLTRASGSREKNAAWSPDGRWVAFVSDRTGEEQVYLIDQKGEKEWRQLTKKGRGFLLPLVWSPDSKYLLFSDKSMRLNLLDVDKKKVEVIATCNHDDAWERWGIQDYVWSPDSRWIAYTKMEQSMNEAIFLYSMEQKKSHRVTGEMTEDWSPSFDPQGRYLYFLSNRTFEPTMGFVDQNHIFLVMCQPYVVILQDGEPSPFAPKETHEEVEDEEAEADE